MTQPIPSRRFARALVACLLLVLVTFGWFTERYGSFMWWWAPDRIHPLGRSYLKSQLPSMTEAQMRERVGGPVQTVGHLPLGQAIVGPTGYDLPTVVYVHKYRGGYESYSLQGGP